MRQPLLDISDPPRRQNTPNMTAGTHAEEKPSIFWSATRSPANFDAWTRRWTLLHFYQLNPLDAVLEQENAIPSPDVDSTLRPEVLFKADEPPPTDAPFAGSTAECTRSTGDSTQPCAQTVLCCRLFVF
ncbi:hypothetical protein AAVH_21420 [Aphelenchoides avenae]|nr:hypothetical protein AAVH_21420 [Aphelenchus avenae]